MTDLTQRGLEPALHAVLLVALTAWAAWWALALLVAVVDPRTAARFGPPLLRAVLVGGVLAASVAPAHAGRGTPAGALDGLPMPERPVTATAAPVPLRPPAATGPSSESHTVEAGESLWSIVRARSPDADDADLAIAVARWYAANRDVIGPRPDLIHPGQRLVPPGAP